MLIVVGLVLFMCGFDLRRGVVDCVWFRDRLGFCLLIECR